MGDDLGTREEETGPVAASASVWIVDRILRVHLLQCREVARGEVAILQLVVARDAHQGLRSSRVLGHQLKLTPDTRYQQRHHYINYFLRQCNFLSSTPI